MSRPDLDDHCEDVMHLRLGLMSLKRLALDLVQEMVANDQLDKADRRASEETCGNGFC